MSLTQDPPVRTFNKKLAVEPFPDMSVRTSATGTSAVKVGRIENKAKLTYLKVVFHSENDTFQPGDTVAVRSDLFALPWAKEVHELSGRTFILMPEGHVEARLRYI